MHLVEKQHAPFFRFVVNVSAVFRRRIVFPKQCPQRGCALVNQIQPWCVSTKCKEMSIRHPPCPPQCHPNTVKIPKRGAHLTLIDSVNAHAHPRVQRQVDIIHIHLQCIHEWVRQVALQHVRFIMMASAVPKLCVNAIHVYVRFHALFL
jgi:hypothetical protein